MPTVLLVEDDPQVIDILAVALTDRGLKVRRADGGRTAQRVLSKEAGQIDVLVADVNLGASASGFDVARRARRLNPRIEVVYITGHALDVDRFGVGGGVLLPKPFDLNHFVDVVEALARSPG
jgi:DNA-binding response OmpR family regulator